MFFSGRGIFFQICIHGICATEFKNIQRASSPPPGTRCRASLAARQRTEECEVASEATKSCFWRTNVHVCRYPVKTVTEVLCKLTKFIVSSMIRTDEQISDAKKAPQISRRLLAVSCHLMLKSGPACRNNNNV